MDSVKICNLALMMLGLPTISSLDDTNNNAKLCKAFFPVLRDRVLRDHNWSFATASYDLVSSGEESFDPKYEYVCPLPGDVIRVLGTIGDLPYRRVERALLINTLPATLIYIRRVEDTDLFDVTFAEAMQYLLVAELGMANTRDASLISMYRQEYERRLSIARSIDSQENRFNMQQPPQKSHWIEARRASGVPCRTAWTTGTEGKQI